MAHFEERNGMTIVDQEDTRQGTAVSSQIFREKSLDRMGSSHDLHAYMRGSGRITWMAVVAIALIIVAVCVWASLTSPEYLINIIMGQGL